MKPGNEQFEAWYAKYLEEQFSVKFSEADKAEFFEIHRGVYRRYETQKMEAAYLAGKKADPPSEDQ